MDKVLVAQYAHSLPPGPPPHAVVFAIPYSSPALPQQLLDFPVEHGTRICNLFLELFAEYPTAATFMKMLHWDGQDGAWGIACSPTVY